MASSILGSLLLEIVTKANTSGLNKTDNAIKKVGRTLQNTSKNASLLGKLTNKMFGGLNFSVISNAFKDYLQFEKDLGAMHSRFFAITKNEREATEEFEYIRKLATDTAMDVKSTADSYSIFYSATRKALGKEGARGVFENWTRVGRVLHLSEYQMERVTYALREMASKGTIYSQDLRMQIGTHVPNAMELARKSAEQLGITGSDWFEKLQKASKGNAELTTKFVKLFSQNAREMFGSEEAFKKAMQQPDALAGMIKNFRYNFAVEFSKAGGSYMIVKILDSTLQLLRSIDFYAMAQNLGQIARFIGNLFKFTTDHLSQITFLLKSILIFLAVRKVGTMLGGAGGVLGAFGNYKTIANSPIPLKGARYKAFAGLRSALTGMGLPKVVTTGILVATRSGVFKLIGFVAKSLLRFLGGPWVLVASLLIQFIPKIWSWVAQFIADKKNPLSAYGTNAQELYQTLSDISKNKNIKTTEQLQQALAKTKAGKAMWANASYNDNGQIVINFNGSDLTLDQMKNMAGDTAKDVKQKTKVNFFGDFFQKSEIQKIRDTRK